MVQKYIGMRFAVLSGGSHKVTIPKEIVKERWSVQEARIPICFLLMDGRIILEHISNIPKDSAFTNEIVKQAEKDWLEYAMKYQMKQEKQLLEQYIEGTIDEQYYRRQLKRFRQSYQRVSKRLRSSMIERGLHFIDLDEVEDVFKMQLLFSEEEKDERCMEIVDEIASMQSEENHLSEMLSLLEERTKRELINKKIGEDARLRIEEELRKNRQRLGMLKSVICSDK